jgi:hypothetical protein
MNGKFYELHSDEFVFVIKADDDADAFVVPASFQSIYRLATTNLSVSKSH